MQNMPIGIFRGDDTDAFDYQTIVGTINTDLDLTGCKAVFRYLDFSMEFDPIPEDKKITIIIPADETKKFPPGLGYASLRVYDSEGRLKTFSNRIMVFVATKTPMFGSDEFEVDFNVRATLEPLKFFVGPNPDDFDEYRGYVEKVIDRASAEKYGLAILLDAIDSDLGAVDGVAATPVAVKAAYSAIIDKLTDDYYTAEQTDEAIDRVAAYYITYDAAGNPFPTYAALANAQTVYSGGKVRIPTRNDYCVVLADEMHQGAEYRYIYAVAEGQTTGSWQPQFPVEGVMTVDQSVTKDSQNPVSGGGVWSAIWGALSALPTGFSSLYDWCVAQLAGKANDNAVVKLTGDQTIVGNKTFHDATQFQNDVLVGDGDLVVGTVGVDNTNFFTKGIRTYGHPAPIQYPAYNGLGKDFFALIQHIAPDYDGETSHTYAVNELCSYQGAVYRCVTAHTATSWVAANWALATVEDVLAALRTTIAGKADVSAIPYSLGTPIVINTASSDPEGEMIYFGAATLADRTANIVQVLAPLDELRITFPTATSGKVRDFGLRVEIGTGSAALAAPALVPIAPTGETIKIENNAKEIPALADGTATAKGVTLLYFSENAPEVFVVKGEQVEEVA